MKSRLKNMWGATCAAAILLLPSCD